MGLFAYSCDLVDIHNCKSVEQAARQVMHSLKILCTQKQKAFRAALSLAMLPATLRRPYEATDMLDLRCIRLTTAWPTLFCIEWQMFTAPTASASLLLAAPLPCSSWLLLAAPRCCSFLLLLAVPLHCLYSLHLDQSDLDPDDLHRRGFKMGVFRALWQASNRELAQPVMSLFKPAAAVKQSDLWNKWNEMAWNDRTIAYVWSWHWSTAYSVSAALIPTAPLLHCLNRLLMLMHHWQQRISQVLLQKSRLSLHI